MWSQLCSPVNVLHEANVCNAGSIVPQQVHSRVYYRCVLGLVALSCTWSRRSGGGVQSRVQLLSLVETLWRAISNASHMTFTLNSRGNNLGLYAPSMSCLFQPFPHQQMAVEKLKGLKHIGGVRLLFSLVGVASSNNEMQHNKAKTAFIYDGSATHNESHYPQIKVTSPFSYVLYYLYSFVGLFFMASTKTEFVSLWIPTLQI